MASQQGYFHHGKGIFITAKVFSSQCGYLDLEGLHSQLVVLQAQVTNNSSN